MRCALMYDVTELFGNQKVAAWGEYQSLTEEPCYKETDIKGDGIVYFNAYKNAMDDAIGAYEAIHEDGSEDFRESCAGELCMVLFSILDEQDEQEDADNE